MGNPFDQFDRPAAGANPFDKFDDLTPKAEQNSGILGDTVTDVKRGFQQLPGALTGLADIVNPLTYTNNRRFFDEGADWIGKQTGFQPGKWQEEAAKEYSPERQASDEAVNKAWEQGGIGNIAETYLTRPRSIAGIVGQALPATAGGGFIARGAMKGIAALSGADMLALRTAAAAGDKSALTAMNRMATTAGGIGEGAITAGMSMDQVSRDVDPSRAALTSATSGVLTGAIGKYSGRLANKLGLPDLETVMAGGGTGIGGMPWYKRIPSSIVQESLLQEFPQSAQEQIMQNIAEKKPWDEGVARASIEGALAGAAMGGGVAMLPQQKPNENATNTPPTNPPNTPPTNPLLAQVTQTFSPQPGSTSQLDQTPTSFDVPKMLPPSGPLSGAVGIGRMSGAIPPEPVLRERDFVPPPSGSYGQLAEFENLLNSERADKQSRVSDLLSGQAVQAASEAESQQARVEAAQAQQSAQERYNLLQQVADTLPDGRNLKRAFGRALKEAGYSNLDFTPEETASIDNFNQINRSAGIAANIGPDIEPSTPNELDASQFIKEKGAKPEPKRHASNLVDRIHELELIESQDGLSPQQVSEMRGLISQLDAQVAVKKKGIAAPTQTYGAQPTRTTPLLQTATNLGLPDVAQAVKTKQGQEKEQKAPAANVAQDSKEPWKMSSQEYDSPVEKEKREIFYVRSGSNNIEVIRNPSGADLSDMKKEFRREFPNATKDDPALRHTEDVSGNSYYWKGHLGAHQHIEPEISKRYGVAVNQNAAQKMSHRYVVRRALYDGFAVPDSVIAEYPGIIEEVRGIEGNKLSPKPAPAIEQPTLPPESSANPAVAPQQAQKGPGLSTPIKSYAKKTAMSVASMMTRNGSPTEAYPHPSGDGTYALRVPGSGSEATPKKAETNSQSIPDRSPKPPAEDTAQQVLNLQAYQITNPDPFNKDDMPLSIDDALFELEVLQDRADKGKLTVEAFAQSAIAKRLDTAQIGAINASIRAGDTSFISALHKRIGRNQEKAQSAPALADNARSDASLERSKARNDVRFETPYVGKDGVSLVGYVWPNKKEEYIDARGEDRIRVVSDWEAAVQNLETGRQIVHQFAVRKQDGTEQDVSAETAAVMLGVSESTVRGNAKKLLEKEIARAKNHAKELAYADKVEDIDAQPSPALAVDNRTMTYSEKSPMVERMAKTGKGWGEVEDRIERESAALEKFRFLKKDGKYIWSAELASDGSELFKRGWRNVELTAREIWPVAKQPTAQQPAKPTPAETTEGNEKLKAKRELIADMIETKRLNRENVPAAWETQLAGIDAQLRGEIDASAIYSLVVDGHPMFDGPPILRNLIPIKVTNSAEAERKLFAAQTLEAKLLGERSKAKHALSIAKTANQKNIAKKALQELDNSGITDDALETLRNVTLPELLRLSQAADERFGTTPAETPKAETPEATKGDNSIRHNVSDAWYYSALERHIDSLNTKSAPAQGWKDQIKGAISKGLVKAAEVEAVGINDWLDLQQGRVSKDQVQQFLDQNGVKVEEVTLGDANTKFSKDDLQLPGGENYKELLLTLPWREQDGTETLGREGEVETFITWMPGARDPFGRPQPIEPQFIGRSVNLEAANQSAELLRQNPDVTNVEVRPTRVWTGLQKPQFQSSHFDQPNILAHVRFNERTDADGKKVLFIEELQSDWGQKGKKDGFETARKYKPVGSAEYSGFVTRMKDAAAEELVRRGNGNLTLATALDIANLQPISAVAEWAGMEQEFAEITARQEEDYQFNQRGKFVPSAPFVTNTQAWTALSLKRMIRYAAENGFDKVAWANGEQQAARYDLSKQMKSISAYRRKNGNFNLSGYSINNDKVDIGWDIPIEKVDDFVGKSLAQKIDEDLTSADQNKTYSDVDLKVGGEGMKGYYDRIVPSVANDVLKKIGGGRVGEVLLDTSSEAEDLAVPRDQRIAEEPTKQQGFDITPKMRESVMSGQALFNRTKNEKLTPSDKAIYGMAAEGKSAKDILKFIAASSRNPFYRQLARLLLKTGIAPKITVGDGKGFTFNAGNDKKYAASYNPKTDTVALFRPASSERHVLHELVHAATIKALSKNGMAAVQMRALFNHVKATGKMNGMYGMENVDEFVAEVFSNPKFQELLKQIAAPEGSARKTVWDRFISVIRGILGLKPISHDALSRALSLGLGVMHENMKLSEGKNLTTKGNVGAGSATINVDGVERPRLNSNGKPIAQTDEGIRNFWKWFGDSKVTDDQGRPLVVYHGTDTSISQFNPRKRGSNTGASSARKAFWFSSNSNHAEHFNASRIGNNVMPAYLSLKSAKVIEHSMLDAYDAHPAVSTKAETRRLKELSAATRKGLDGVVFNNTFDTYASSDDGSGAYRVNLYAVFRPEQIKSATGNNGQFSPENNDIRYNVIGDSGRAYDQALDIDSIPAFADIRKPKENLNTLASSYSNAARVVGNKVVSVESLSGGTYGEVNDTARVSALAKRLKSEGSYFERLVVDDAGNVIEGQHRLDALRYLGAKNVPVVVIQNLEMGFPSDAVRAAIKKSQKIHPDHVNQLSANLAEIYADENGDIEQMRLYEPPKGFERAWNAGIDAAEKSDRTRHNVASDWMDNNAPTSAGDGDTGSATINVDGVERSRLNSNGKPIAQTDEGIRNFWKWFAGSKVTDDQGRPLVVYHGSPDVRGIFSEGFKAKNRGSVFFAAKGYDVANSYADNSRAFDYQNAEPQTIPLYASIKNPMIVDAKGAFWRETERHVEEAKSAGHDGIIIKNSVDFYNNPKGKGKTTTVYAWFSPTQAKSAVDGNLQSRVDLTHMGQGRTRPIPGATGNNGQFSPENNDIRYNVIGDSGRAYDQAHRDFFKNVGRDINPESRLQKSLNYLRNDFWKKMAVGIVDQFRGLRDLGDNGTAYMLARLSKGTAGAFDTLLHHGKLTLRDGVYDGDTSGGFVERLGVPLHGELDDVLWWIAANRAWNLAPLGKENLFSPSDIAAGKSLANGTTAFDYTIQTGPARGTVTRNRSMIYADAHRVFNEFQKNTLDMAEQSGLIDGNSRKTWESEFYVPFYRVSEEDGEFVGAQISGSLVRKRAFQKLKGGTDKLNSDLLSNTLQNWAHLITASAQNRAARAALAAAENVGVAQRVAPDMASYAASNGTMLPPGTKKTVWFQENGKKVEYLVTDPFVMTAITSLEYAGMRNGIMDAMTKFKHALTIGVTASPAFKVRNLIRDSLQAIGTSDLGYNPIKNVTEGYKQTRRDSQEYVSALASGGLIRFGTMLEGSESSRVRQLIKAGVKDSTILNSDNKWQAFYDKVIDPAVSAYNELGNRSEEINRAALYNQLIKQGKSHAEAALLARDLMDFSMQGSFNTIRFLSQVVPFFNARLQGMYKLGRAARDDPKKMAVVTGALALASIALMAGYHDDDDWKRREDWDRDNYWWFKLGGIEYRIPKPFELGAVATLAERSVEYLTNDEMTGERFRNVIWKIAENNLSMNPVPQMVKPIIDLYANKDSFTGRPIETMGMQRLDSDMRFNSNTSMPARALSTATLGALSPVQYDHLVRAYFGWIGATAVSSADMAARVFMNEPTKPALDYWKVATQGMMKEQGSGSSRYLTLLYDQASELEQAYGTYRQLLKDGKFEDAKDYYESNADKLKRYKFVNSVKSMETKLNASIRSIERSDASAEEKKARIERVQAMKERVAKRVAPGLQ